MFVIIRNHVASWRNTTGTNYEGGAKRPARVTIIKCSCQSGLGRSVGCLKSEMYSPALVLILVSR